MGGLVSKGAVAKIDATVRSILYRRFRAAEEPLATGVAAAALVVTHRNSSGTPYTEA